VSLSWSYVSPTISITVTETAPAAPVFTAATPPGAMLGASYTYTFEATNDPTFALGSGSFPAGLTLNPITGVLSGTPTKQGGSFTVTATNGPGPGESATTPLLTVGVGAGAVFTCGLPPQGTVGENYSFAVTVAGTPTPTVSVLSGVLPAGLSLTSAGVSGTTVNAQLIQGVPTVADPFTVELEASNGVGSPAILGPVSITIVAAPLPGSTVTAPVNYGAPVISDLAPYVDETLSVSNGLWVETTDTPPVNLTLPVITPSTPVVGVTETVTTGTWQQTDVPPVSVALPVISTPTPVVEVPVTVTTGAWS
jgi:hypothetical protein